MHYIRHKTIDYMEVAAGIQQRISSYTICGGNVVPHWSIETSTMYRMYFRCSQLKFFLRYSYQCLYKHQKLKIQALYE